MGASVNRLNSLLATFATAPADGGFGTYSITYTQTQACYGSATSCYALASRVSMDGECLPAWFPPDNPAVVLEDAEKPGGFRLEAEARGCELQHLAERAASGLLLRQTLDCLSFCS
jgi:hypothetical protein